MASATRSGSPRRSPTTASPRSSSRRSCARPASGWPSHLGGRSCPSSRASPTPACATSRPRASARRRTWRAATISSASGPRSCWRRRGAPRRAGACGRRQREPRAVPRAHRRHAVELAGLGCLQEVDPIGAFHAAKIPGKAVLHVDNVLYSVREALQAVLLLPDAVRPGVPQGRPDGATARRAAGRGSFLLDPARRRRTGLEVFARRCSGRRSLLVLGRESVMTEEDQARRRVAERFSHPRRHDAAGPGCGGGRRLRVAVGSIGSGPRRRAVPRVRAEVAGRQPVRHRQPARQLATNSFRDLADGGEGLNIIADDPHVLAKYPVNHGLVARDPTAALRVLLELCEAAEEQGSSGWTLAELAG